MHSVMLYGLLLLMMVSYPGGGEFLCFSQKFGHKIEIASLEVQDGLHTEKEPKIWSTMNYCMILYVSWDLNESLGKIQE